MTNVVPSQMQYKNYAVAKIIVESNTNSIQSPDKIDELIIDFNVLKEEGQQSFLIELFIDVNKTAKAFKGSRYKIFLKLLSVFEFSSNTSKEEIHKLLVPNGLAMAYSTSRGIIGELTANSINGKYILPSVNFMELIKRKARKSSNKKISTKKVTV